MIRLFSKIKKRNSEMTKKPSTMLAIFLSIVLVVSLVPINSWAETTEESTGVSPKAAAALADEIDSSSSGDGDTKKDDDAESDNESSDDSVKENEDDSSTADDDNASFEDDSSNSDAKNVDNEEESDGADNAKTDDSIIDDGAQNKKKKAAGSSEDGISAQSDTGFKTGDCVRVASNEGYGVIYKITSTAAKTVSVGGYISGVQNQTIDYEFTGPLTIPSKISVRDPANNVSTTFTVTSIGDSAFAPYKREDGSSVSCKISSITIPSTVTTIGNKALQGTSMLSTVSFSGQSSLVSIGTSAFSGSNIGSISIPASTTTLGSDCFSGSKLSKIVFLGEKISTIPSGCFSETNLQNIDFLPTSVRYINENAFKASAITSANIKNSVTVLGDGVFYDCKSLKSSTIANGSMLEAIPPYTFAGCTSLSKYEIPSFISSIEMYAFSESGLVTIDIPPNITYIDENAYARCTSAIEINFDSKNELMYIQERVFQGCSKLLTAKLPSSIREIRQEAFSGCTSLETFEVPKSCMKLEASSFYNCTSLETLIFLGDARYISLETSTFFRDNKLKKVVFRNKRCTYIDLYITASIPTYYYTLTYYNSKKLALEGGAESGHISLAAGKIPSSASSVFKFDGNYIEKPSDDGMWIYESDISPHEAITDSFYAYRYDPEEELRVGATFTAVSADGAKITYTVESISPDGGKTPGTVSVGYKDSISIKSAIDEETTGGITIPEKVIGTDGFTYQVRGINDNSFYGCSYIRSITIPASVTEKPGGLGIGARAFAKCTKLQEVTFKGDVKELSDNQWFLGCGNIKTVTFGGKKTNISFGTSNPVFYYTIRYYANKNDYNANLTCAVLVVKERSLPGSLKSTDIISGGSVPALLTGYEWVYEQGFGAKIPLEDSTKIYQTGVGFQITVSVTGSSDYSSASCWFSVIDADESKKTGTCRVGLAKDLAEKAVHTAINGNVVIPSTVTYDGITYTVTEVGDYAFGSSSAFYACTYITGATLPSSITRIGTYAFGNCWNMESALIPTSVYEMGTCAYLGCRSLSVANFRTGSLITTLPASTFQGTENLATVILPDNLKTIGNSCFQSSKIKSITFPSTLKTINANAFYGSSLTGQVTFSENVSSIGESAFYMCTQVTSLLFTGNASKVTFGSKAFYFMGPSAFSNVIFRDKRSNTIGTYIYATGPRGVPIAYKTYNTISCYTSTSNYNAGKVASYYVYLHQNNPLRTPPLSGTIPTLGSNQAWTYEPGFDPDERSYDSFYMIAGKDISKATVSFPNSVYYYTGNYIRPASIVRWTDGTLLREGVDYKANELMGSNRDGYVDNRTNGKASFYIVGIGDYAGYTSGTFIISERYDTVNSGFSATVTLEKTRYEYDGTAKCPKVSVKATMLGMSFENLVEGSHYTLSYRNNIKAGTAEAVVTWSPKVPFAGEVKKTFTIDPLSLYDCTIVGLKDSEKVTNEKVKVPTLQITNPYGRVLVAGVDYQVGVSSYGIGKGSIYVAGLGNYTDTVVSNIGYAGEGGSPDGRASGNGGSGGGDGGGNGSGNGSMSGSGKAAFNRSGADSLTRVASNTSDSLNSETGGGGYAALGDGGDGAGQRRIFEIADALAVIPIEQPPNYWFLLFLLLMASALGIGIWSRTAEPWPVIQNILANRLGFLTYKRRAK